MTDRTTRATSSEMKTPMAAEWKEGRYGYHTLNLETVVLTVGWDSNSGGGYLAQYGTHTMSGRWKDLVEAKRAVEKFARKALRRALALLPDDADAHRPDGGEK